MDWNFLGKGCAFNPLYGNTGAYFVQNNELYLLDCGESVFERLFRQIDLDKIEKAYVIITHLHADHVGSLGTLISYFFCVLHKPVYVIHPETTIIDLLTLQGIDKRGYCYSALLPDNRAGLSAEPVPVQHAEDMKCYGYLLRDASECIYYSGDAAMIPEKVLDLFISGKIARIYHDTSTHDSPKPSHCYYGKIETLIPREMRNQFYCMHLDSPCEAMLEKLGFRIVE